jgi:hypothetical protein
MTTITFDAPAKETSRTETIDMEAPPRALTELAKLDARASSGTSELISDAFREEVLADERETESILFKAIAGTLALPWPKFSAGDEPFFAGDATVPSKRRRYVVVKRFSWPEETETILDQEARPRSEAFAAFKDLVRWLSATDADVAAMLGVGRTTPYTSWDRLGHPPRAASARRLFQTHAALAAVMHELGEEQGIRWLSFEDPSRREAVLAGNLQRLDDDLHELLFRPGKPRLRRGGWVADDEDL